MITDHILHRTYTRRRLSSEVFLDDYAFCIKGMLDLYTVTSEDNWFKLAYALTEQVTKDFTAVDRVLYNFSPSSSGDSWNHQEVQDNVIPSSNGVMAENLFLLSRLSGNQKMETRAVDMIRRMYGPLCRYPRFHYQWGYAALNLLFPFFETAVTGPAADKTASDFHKAYLPGTLICAARERSSIPLLKDRISPDKTQIIVCRDKTCFPPGGKEEAFRLLKNQDTLDR
jgi:hypothetical protein